jgi:hypothetical protein
MSFATMFVVGCILVLVLALEIQVGDINKKLDSVLKRRSMP